MVNPNNIKEYLSLLTEIKEINLSDIDGYKTLSSQDKEDISIIPNTIENILNKISPSDILLPFSQKKLSFEKMDKNVSLADVRNKMGNIVFMVSMLDEKEDKLVEETLPKAKKAINHICQLNIFDTDNNNDN